MVTKHSPFSFSFNLFVVLMRYIDNSCRSFSSLFAPNFDHFVQLRLRERPNSKRGWIDKIKFDNDVICMRTFISNRRFMISCYKSFSPIPLFTVSVHIPYRFSSLSSFIVNLKARLPFESQPLDTAGKRIDPLLLIRHFYQLIYYTVLKIAKPRFML